MLGKQDFAELLLALAKKGHLFSSLILSHIAVSANYLTSGLEVCSPLDPWVLLKDRRHVWNSFQTAEKF